MNMDEHGVFIDSYNVGKTILNHPFGNGLYPLFIVIWGMVYYCFTHIRSGEIITTSLFSLTGNDG